MMMNAATVSFFEQLFAWWAWTNQERRSARIPNRFIDWMLEDGIEIQFE